MVSPHTFQRDATQVRRVWTDERARYVADWAFALPAVAFFMSAMGVFIIGYALTQLLALSRRRGPPIWRRGVAASRYLSYRGFRIAALEWNSAPIGVLMLGAIGTIFFFCALEADLLQSKAITADFCKAWIWSHLRIIGQEQTRSGATRHR